MCLLSDNIERIEVLYMGYPHEPKDHQKGMKAVILEEAMPCQPAACWRQCPVTMHMPRQLLTETYVCLLLVPPHLSEYVKVRSAVPSAAGAAGAA
jgi:hypothetical protein